MVATDNERIPISNIYSHFINGNMKFGLTSLTPKRSLFVPSKDTKPPGVYFEEDPDPLEIHKMVIITIGFPDLVISDVEVEMQTHLTVTAQASLSITEDLLGYPSLAVYAQSGIYSAVQRLCSYNSPASGDGTSSDTVHLVNEKPFSD